MFREKSMIGKYIYIYSNHKEQIRIDTYKEQKCRIDPERGIMVEAASSG